nr:MAG TPA: hypothetical protein [Caudoviricetes sp.]
MVLQKYICSINIVPIKYISKFKNKKELEY